jgi:hypothetical protein
MDELPKQVVVALKKSVPELCSDEHCRISDRYLGDPLVERFFECMKNCGLEKANSQTVLNSEKNYRITCIAEYEPSDFKTAEFIVLSSSDWTPDDDYTLKEEAGRLIVIHEDERFLEPFYQGNSRGTKLSSVVVSLDGNLCVSAQAKQILECQGFTHLLFKEIWIQHEQAEAKKIEEYFSLNSDVYLLYNPDLFKSEVESVQPVDFFWAGYDTGHPQGEMCVSQKVYQFWNKHFPGSASWERPVVLV